MINLTIDWKKEEFDFMGEKVTAIIRPLKSTAFNLALPFFQTIDPSMGEEEAVKRTFEMQALAKDIFPEHLQDYIEGVQINNAPVTVEQLSEEAMLSTLTIMILTKMMEITRPDEESEKN